jgi:redox-sensitive bicupin YhaK (pirin superfamily)
MITLRPAAERGLSSLDWLKSFHSFSFGEYRDRRHMGFRALRVINDDTVDGGAGFQPHSHRDMEIVTYVIDGALRHQDSLGNKFAIGPGEVQRMTAGTGITHSEMNDAYDQPVHFLQIWILPDRSGIAPGYEQKAFAAADKDGTLRLIVSPDGADGSLRIHQDTRIYASRLAPGATVSASLAAGRSAWVQVVAGSLRVNGRALAAGDGIAVEGESALTFAGPDAGDTAEFLLFDLA